MKKIGKAIEKIDAKSAYQLVSITLADAQFILKNEQFLHEDSVQKEGTEIARKGIISVSYTHLDKIRNLCSKRCIHLSKRSILADTGREQGGIRDK